MRIDLPVDYDRGRRVVRAEIIDCAPHLATVASFAVHHGWDFGYEWTVTNIETGLPVSGRGHTKKQAIAAARLVLADKTCADILWRYRIWHRCCGDD